MRSFIDTNVLLYADSSGESRKQAVAIDPGFDVGVLAEMMRTLARFSDEEIPAPPDLVPAIRAYFAEWAERLVRHLEPLLADPALYRPKRGATR